MTPDILGIQNWCFHFGLQNNLPPFRTVRSHGSDGSHIMGLVGTESMSIITISMSTQRPFGTCHVLDGCG